MVIKSVRRLPLVFCAPLSFALTIALAQYTTTALAQSSALTATPQIHDDAAFFDAYLAAKRESPRSPVKALIESALWAAEENAAPYSLTAEGRDSETLVAYAESLYKNAQYNLAAQALAKLSENHRRPHATRIAILQTQLALRGIGTLPNTGISDGDGRLILNQALATLNANVRSETESRKQAIAHLRKLATQDAASPIARQRAALWIALLQHQNGQSAEALQTLAAIDGQTALPIDTLLIWLRVQPALSPGPVAAVERHIAGLLPASPAAWEAREALFNSLLTQGAVAQAGQMALEGIKSGSSQIERINQLLARQAQGSLSEALATSQYLPEENRKKIATLLERRDKLSVERRLNAWLPYLFSYRGRLQNDPDKFFTDIRTLVSTTRDQLIQDANSPKERPGLLRFDIRQLTGTPPAENTAYRLFTGLAKWELDAGYPANWRPEDHSPSQSQALKHTAQLINLIDQRYQATLPAKKGTIQEQLKSASERNNALMNEIRRLSPTIEQALRDEVATGLHERRRIAQQWVNRFAFHALDAFSRHDPDLAQTWFDIDKARTLSADEPLLAQLQKIPSERHTEKIARTKLEQTTSALSLLIDTGESREISATGLRLRAQILVALTEAQVINSANEAIRDYQTLLKSYADLIDRAETSYQLARAQEMSRRPADLLATLNAFVDAYPGDSRRHEVMFRIGEIHFAAGDYSRARSAYAAMIALGESRYREQAEYKLGWTHYQLGEFREALPHFIAVIDRADDKNRTASRSADRFQKERIKDSFRAIALTFSNISSEGEIERYFNQPGRRQHLPNILAGVAALHLERDRIQDADTSYKQLIRQYPNHPRGPELLAGIVRGAQRLGLNRFALAGKEEFAQRYATSGAYWKQADPDVRQQTGGDLRQFLGELATLYHADAQQQSSDASRKKAVQYYGQYIDGFPDDREVPRLLFLRGEAHAEAGELSSALADYERSTDQFGPHANSAEAGYAALVTREKLIAHGNTPAERQSRLRELVSRSSRFAGSFAGDPRIDAVLAKAGEDILMLGEAAEAVTLGENLLARNPSGEIRKRAQVLLAHALFETRFFERAENAYSQALTLGGHSAEIEKTLRERRGLAIYRQAEAQRAAGNAAQATENFLRVSRVVPESDLVASAEIDAAALLIENKRWNDAIALLERFLRDRPTHALAATIPVRLAVAYENTGRLLLAADMMETLSQAELRKETGGDRALAAQELLRAAELRARENKRELAVATLERYLTRFPEPLEAAVEVRQKLADLATSAGDLATRNRWLNEIIEVSSSAASNSLRIRYLAAQAQVVFGDLKTAEFATIALRLPFDKTLADKRRALEQAVRSYEAASRYGIVEVTTGATYKTAELYRQLSHDILASELPGGLKPLELDQYKILLEEQALPFDEKAIKLHELNLARIAAGKTGGIYDEWIKRSMISLRTLVPGQYDRSERTGTYFTYIPPAPATNGPAPEKVLPAPVSKTTTEEVVDGKNGV